MPKVVLLPVTPKEAEAVLKEKATVLVKKYFPKNYTGWVYLYCTKKKPYLYDFRGVCGEFRTEEVRQKYFDHLILNGKVVAAMWCYRVEEIECRGSYGNYEGLELNDYYTYTMDEKELFTKSCLRLKDFNDYLDNGKKIGHAIHVAKLFKFPYPTSVHNMHRVGFCEARKNVPFIADKYKIIDWDKLMEYENFLREWHVITINSKWQYVDATEEELSQYDRL